MNEDYKRGFIDGMQKQMQSSVDKAVNAMSKKEWVELTKEEIFELCTKHKDEPFSLLLAVQDKLKEKNNG